MTTLIKLFLLVIAGIGPFCGYAQSYSNSSILSHNDYLQETPFANAYNQEVGYIEADVFLRDGDLMVAHTAMEISKQRTLEFMYLQPLQIKVGLHAGFVFPDRERVLTLMIDFKTDGASTMEALLRILQKYLALVNCPSLRFVISGNVPPRSQWKSLPSFIYIDGRPGNDYSPAELHRIAFISDAFSKYSSWRGDGTMSNDDLNKIKHVVEASHRMQKPFRFWGIPDEQKMWAILIEQHVDILGSDRVNDLSAYLAERP